MPKAAVREVPSRRFSPLLSTARLAKKSHSVLIFTHRQADPDALCSAYAIARLASGERSQNERSFCKIVTPQGASVLAANICKEFSIPYDEKINDNEIEKAEFIFFVDVGDDELLEPYLASIRKSRARKFLLDHHSSGSEVKENSKGRLNLFDGSLLDSKATSTCEIVALAFPEKLLDEKLSKVLLVGLLYDSQHLGIATQSTLEAALKLVRKGAMISEAKELLRMRPDRSEIIARLKSAQRLRYEELGKYLLAETEISSFQAAAARTLIDIGADIAIAFGEHDEETRASVRTSQRFDRETGINVGVLLSKISDKTGMSGGGHSTAGSISGKLPSAIVRQRIVEELKIALP